jgi:hypothetical protein
MRPPLIDACLAGLVALLVFTPAAAQEQRRLEVELDTSQVADKPALVQWGEDAKALMEEWHPRLVNLLQTPGFEPLYEVRLVIRDSDEGIAFAQGNHIVVSSHWIEAHPEDIGLVVHELVHVVQHYRRPVPGWVTEGIADYLRWAIYEGKPQRWFRRPNEPRAYRQGYRTAAGFFLWLEADQAPGIVARLNSAARRGEYDDDLFETATGKTLDTLWDEYRREGR